MKKELPGWAAVVWLWLLSLAVAATFGEVWQWTFLIPIAVAWLWLIVCIVWGIYLMGYNKARKEGAE